MPKKEKILLAMSGGVDSSVSACLLQERGYEVMGVHFRMVEKKNEEARVREICNLLGIKFYPINIAEKFQKEVIDYFVTSYERGETPNPCTRCNKVIKFRELLRVADELGIEKVATGHYALARSQKSKVKSQKYILSRGVDAAKDQSYFLYRLGQEELRRIIFPLGKIKKAEVKELAREQGFPQFRGESQDVCFLVENGKIIDHNEFLKERIKLKPGPIKLIPSKKRKSLTLTKGDDRMGSLDGEIGIHQGLPLYTIGQRRGVDIGGTGPYYVVKCDYETNTLFVTNDPEDEALYSNEFFVSDVNWVLGTEPDLPFECEVQVRYRGETVECEITKVKSQKSKVESYLVKLKKPERAVTLGQSAVFYFGNKVLGGGIIV